MDTRRVAIGDSMIGNVLCYYSARSNKRVSADSCSWQDDCAPTNRGTCHDYAVAHLPIGIYLQRSIRVNRARSTIVEQHRARTNEDTVFELKATKHVSAILELTAVSNSDACIHVTTLPQNAVAANYSVLAYLSLMPYPSTLTKDSLFRHIS